MTRKVKIRVPRESEDYMESKGYVEGVVVTVGDESAVFTFFDKERLLSEIEALFKVGEPLVIKNLVVVESVTAEKIRESVKWLDFKEGTP